ncbi:MAG TPA: tRNA (adenosine(37)-N6)-threonylcarbamoyltransferase complex ATPase subunit type 1 TsaE [Myxococcales bacterium]|nr:tRNA (adenosine(37)-N6)-threonylcarbamoyltransferase complex ATPase subunit type 1 TsaE [Myxococcales bacterium]
MSRAWRQRREREPGEAAAGRGTGLAISLRGDLGAGKTVFVKGLARGMGIDEELVSSPTFVLANEYPSLANGLALHHVDFYRLEAAGELESMGFYDLMVPNALLAVEWGSKFSEELPLDRIDMTIETDAERTPEGRVISAWGTGPRTRGLLPEWRRLLAAGGRATSMEAGNSGSWNF